MSRQNKETAIQNEILCAIGAQDHTLIWRNQVGKFRAIDDPRRIVSVGTRGSADILGICRVPITPDHIGMALGVAIAIEVKTATGRMSPVQARWAQAWQARGGAHCIARSPADAREFIERITSGYDHGGTK